MTENNHPTYPNQRFLFGAPVLRVRHALTSKEL